MTGTIGSAVREAIIARGRVEGPLVKVDDFLNHRVEPGLMKSIGSDLAGLLAPSRPTLILTAEASGIPPALAVSMALDVDVIYAKKYPRTRSTRPAYVREVASPTKDAEYRVEVAHRVLGTGERVAIVDDFLSRGRTAEALGEIVEESGSTVAGLGFVIEKAFMEGRGRLEAHGWAVVALATILSLQDGVVEMAPSGADTGNR
ncbi:MAG TPA: xanthine phosphoribosyltransferase [Acidimicrobiia bacterium]|nr:xanthine phosphoribosyltransferase [Acidimicrobiia bacterium]